MDIRLGFGLDRAGAGERRRIPSFIVSSTQKSKLSRFVFGLQVSHGEGADDRFEGAR